jgi:two-component system chemotaxis response regulator CheB
MRKIRILVVDDSVVIRRILTDILSSDPDIEVVGTASNGKIALAKIPQLNPDLVTLDIEMPEMDGLTTLPEIRKDYPKLPVIMFSTLTERGAVATLDALARGASDYVAKPANVGSVNAGMQSVREQLIPRIKHLCPFTQPSNEQVKEETAGAGAPKRELSKEINRTDIVVIGSSTGGPQALAEVVNALPKDLPVPVVIVQHMPPVFTRHLAERFNESSPLHVIESQGGEVLMPGQIIIAPGDYHLEFKANGHRVTTVLQQGPPENSCRPAVDVLFRSAAEIYGRNTLGVVLTGMGRDGLRGGEAIVDAGGAMIAQNEDTCVVWGMPRAVTEAGLASSILPINQIAAEVQRRASFGRRPVVLT